MLLPAGRCALLAAEPATVNGLSALPLRILADRDEILLDEQRMILSAETSASAVAFAGAPGRSRCGRCQGAIATGDRAVQCPRCQAWHHQTETLPCWTYARTCASCAQPTGGASWQPEPLAARATASRDEHDR